MSELPAADDLGPIIGLRARDGLHSLTGFRLHAQGYPHGKAWTWMKPQTLREQTLLNWDSYLTNGVSGFCGTDHLVIAANYKPGGAPPIRIAEYAMDTQPFRLVEVFDFGDD